MTSIAYIKQILVKNIDSLPNLSVEHIHTFSLGSDMNDTEPLLLITSLSEAGQSFGNNDPIGSTKRVQIQFYYPKDYLGDMELIETSVKKLLRKNQVNCNGDAGAVLTPDTKNILNTLKFIYEKEAI
ncbi:DUF806 family protein [Pediococcus ethanolidurans]|uniref:DUF806 family protein n=1 Tax=Pediococcus ethanolidurans TaxID=319653 RepID=UPI0021E6FCA7|nr:DUF806 family protein [Pediococcus ethanolidurans]MCV3327597.1 DUF806 family protein [Pediococcus ethanolidurans]